MATINFIGLYTEVEGLLPDDRKDLPVKRIVDTIIRASIEDYFEQFELVTDVDALWESLGVDIKKCEWVEVINNLVFNNFLKAVDKEKKEPDYRFAMKYKDGIFIIPYMVTEPRQSSGFTLKAKIDFSILSSILQDSLRFDTRFNPAVEQSDVCERFDVRNVHYLSKELIVHYFKTELHGFVTPTEHPFSEYYTHDELVELAYAITDKENDDSSEERFEDDTIFDLINFIFEPLTKDIDAMMSHILSELEINQSTVVELYQATGKVWVFVSQETIEEIVFREVFNVEESRVVVNEDTGSREYCKCYI